METVKRYVVIGAVVLLALIFISVVVVQRDSALVSLELANKKVEVLKAQIEQSNKQLKAVQQLDKDYQERLVNAQAENDRLRDDFVNNVKRVYVKADCMPKDTATASRSNVTTPRLTGDTRQDYLRLRLEIAQAREQILKLQAYVGGVCLKQ